MQEKSNCNGDKSRKKQIDPLVTHDVFNYDFYFCDKTIEMFISNMIIIV